MMVYTKAVLLVLTAFLILLAGFSSDQQMLFRHMQLFYQCVVLALIVVVLVMIRIVWKLEEVK
jgi:FtsH-binding integral membrane protein